MLRSVHSSWSFILGYAAPGGILGTAPWAAGPPLQLKKSVRTQCNRSNCTVLACLPMPPQGHHHDQGVGELAQPNLRMRQQPLEVTAVGHT